MKLLKKINKIILKIFCRLPVDRKKVVMNCFGGGGYGCNPKYIANEMIRRNKFKIYWLYSPKKRIDLEAFPPEIKLIKIGSLRELYHLCTAGIIVSNVRSGFWGKLKKRKHQRYIQTWHGNMCFKKIEGDCPNLDIGYINTAKRDSKNIDVLLCGTKWRKEVCFEKSFFYDGPIATIGLPRNDIFFCNNKDAVRQKVCSYLDISKDSKILLYAPTFRDSHSLDSYSLDYKKVKDALTKRFGGNWVIVSRLHPNLSATENVLPKQPYIKDGSKYPDMQELLVVSDVLITDYSGCVFDFVLTDRPVFLFATDILEYTNERDFYFKLDSTPFSIAENNKDLIQHINDFKQKDFVKKLADFKKHCGFYDDGCASQKCVDIIENFLKE